jgi:hypothetical protein
MTAETKIALFLLSVLLFSAGINKSCTLNAGVPLPDDTYPDTWMLFPSVRLALDPMYFFSNDSDYSGIFTSAAEIDFLQYRYFIASFSVNQKLYFSNEKSIKFNFQQIRYDIEFINLRREFIPGSLSFFIDHRCSNYINIDAAMEMRTRWYGGGIRWETHGMTTGEKGKRKGVKLFSSDNYINYSLAARIPIYTEYYPADWTADFSLTYDCYPADFISAYLSAAAEYFDSKEYSWNRSIEGGLRISAGPAEITPYLKYNYATDSTSGIPGDKKSFGTGIRAESVLYSTEESAGTEKNTQPGGVFFPEIHFTGSYGYFCGDDKRNFRTDGLFTLDLLKYGSSSIFINASLTHSSPKEQLGMYPAYIDSYYEGGLSYNIVSRILIEPFYRYTEYDEGNIVKTGPCSYELAAMRIRTFGMKPGFADSGIISDSANGLKIISNFEAEISGGYVTETDGIDTEWTTESYVRWDIFGYNSTVLYLMIGEKSTAGDDFSWTFITECGVWTGNDLLAMLFYRNGLNDKKNPSRDISKIYHLIGVKFDF